MLDKIKRQWVEGRMLLQFGVLNAIGQVLGMIAPLIVAKFLTPELFAGYSLARMTMFFFLMLLINSAQAPFIVLANQERAITGRINKTFTVEAMFFVTGVCVSAALMLGFQNYLAAFAGVTRQEYYYICMAFFGYSIEIFVINIFMALNQRMRVSLVDFTFGLLTVGFVLALYRAGAISIKSVFLAHFISSIAVALIFVWVIDFDKLRPFVIDRQQLTAMFDFTKWVLIGSAAVYFVNWGDNLVLRPLAPMSDIGEYNLGYQIFKGVNTLIIIIYTYFLPFVSEHINDSVKMHEYLYRKRPMILLAGAGVIAMLFVVAPYFFRIVYQDVYQGSVAVFRVLLVGAAMLFYSIFYGPVFHAVKRFRFTQMLNVAQAIVNLGVDLLLVPRLGILGAAIGGACGYFCSAATMEIYFRVKLKRTLNV